MNDVMQAVEIAAFGPPEGLRLAERPVPQPGDGELLIRVAASGVNRPDVLQRKGNYAPPAGVSDLPGLEVAGVVESGQRLGFWLDQRARAHRIHRWQDDRRYDAWIRCDHHHCFSGRNERLKQGVWK